VCIGQSSEGGRGSAPIEGPNASNVLQRVRSRCLHLARHLFRKCDLLGCGCACSGSTFDAWVLSSSAPALHEFDVDVECDKGEDVDCNAHAKKDDSVFPDGVADEVERNKYVVSVSVSAYSSWAIEHEFLS